MVTFVRQFGNERLYGGTPGPGQLFLVTPAPCPEDSLPLSRSWTDPDLRATFVYAAAGVVVDQHSADQFVEAVLARIQAAGQVRGVVWLAAGWQSGPLDELTAPLLGLDPGGTRVGRGLAAPIAAGVRLLLAEGAELALDDDRVTARGSVTFDGPRAPVASASATSAELALGGDHRGTLTFQIFLRRPSLRDAASWGFQLAHPRSGGSKPPAGPADVVAQWLPLATAEPADALGFDVVVDPSDPLNTTRTDGIRRVRSMLTFTGLDSDGRAVSLHTYYRAMSGGPVRLFPVSGPDEQHPGALVFCQAARWSEGEAEAYLAPAGDFLLSFTGESDVGALLCGLRGTELIVVRSGRPGQPGARIRFTPYQPAYAARYPFVEVSPVAAPVDVMAALLDPTYTTSWAQIIPSDGVAEARYIGQGGGAELYGRDNSIWNRGTGLMGWRSPSLPLPPGSMFPLLPYAGVVPGGDGFSADTVAAVEAEVVAATRRARIGAPEAPNEIAAPDAALAPYEVATAPGWSVTVDGDRFTRILFGRSVEPPLALGFVNPGPTLRQAFQTPQPFLVLANSTHLGVARPGDGDQPTAEPWFLNTIRIGGWTLSANVGTNNRYQDYRNIMIVKGRRGKLYDPADPAAGLVANPERWTQKEQFSIPTDLVVNPRTPPAEINAPDQAELVILSRWLQDYFADAHRTGGADLARFNAIASDEAWTGVLILRADIAQVPDDLAGIVAGVTDPGRFNAHHLGFDATPLAVGPLGPVQAASSAIFGLIDYRDPRFREPAEGHPPRPVPPDTSTGADFQLLSLRVVFVNSAVRVFRSYAQLTIAGWFGMPVDVSGGSTSSGAIVLGGSLQVNSGQPVYSLTSTAETVFTFRDSVLAKLEITQASMTTRDMGDELGERADRAVSSWFNLSGFLDFARLTGPERAFDVFSFGSEDGAAPRQGLAFTNLGILMSFKPDNPAGRRLVVETASTRFDMSASTSRSGSLMRQFGLEVRGLVSGDADNQPASLGYTTVATDAQLTGVAGGPWWGIEYQLPLGTPGNLAGRRGLTARLVTAWAPATGSGAGYRAMVGLLLPGTGGGAKLISLQTVLTLSLGEVRLTVDPTAEAFLLLFSEIALKAFGLLSLPPGSTSLYLYGDPRDTDSPSGLAWYALYRKKGG